MWNLRIASEMANPDVVHTRPAVSKSHTVASNTHPRKSKTHPEVIYTNPRESKTQPEANINPP